MQIPIISKVDLIRNKSSTGRTKDLADAEEKKNKELNKTKTIFDKVANNKSVTEYFTENSQPEFWIEFPDKMTYYDNKERSWKTK